MGSNQYEIKVAVKTDGDDDVKALGKNLDDIGKITSFKKLGDQIAYSRQKYIDAQMEVDRLADEMANAEKPTKALNRQFEQAEARVGKLAIAHEKSVSAYKTAGVALSDMGIDVKNLDGEMGRLTEASDQLKASIAKTTQTNTSMGLLDVRPYKDVRAEMVQLRESYKFLKTSGTATDEELAKAKANLKSKTAALVRETNSWVGVMSKAEAMNNARGLLDVRPYKDVQSEIKRLQDAYTLLKNSGKLSASEIYKAKVQLKQKTSELIDETNGWSKSIGMAKTSMVALAGVGYTLIRAMSGVSGIMAESGKASFSLEASVRAANKEFSNTGSLSEWESSVKRLSGELGIYSESALKNAISRTIDMTKRLGMSGEQMEEVIKRSGDLGAGKVELEGAVERVTAALRGEAESAEYLGLTLNENYVKSWYNAKAGQDKAWSSLSDLEKAQVRYQVFLEQSDGMQGRAADSANTYAGAMAMVKKEIENAIVNNTDVVAAMNSVASTLRENSSEISQVISGLVSLFAKVIDGIAGLTGWFGNMSDGTGAATVAVSSFIISGLALRKLLSSDLATAFGGMIAHLKDGKAGMIGMESASKSLAASLRGGLYAALIVTLFETGKAYLEMRDAQKEADESSKRLAASEQRLAERFREISRDTGMNITSIQELNRLKREGLIVLDAESHKWSATTAAQRESILASDAVMAKEREVSAQRLTTHDAFVASIEEQGNAAIAKAQEQADAKVITEKAASDQIIGLNLAKYQQLLAAAEQHVSDVGRVEGVGSENYKKAVESQKNAAQKLKDYKVQAAQEITNRLKTELNTQLAYEKRIRGEIEALHEKAADQLVLKEDELREIRRRGMTETQQQADLEKQANEKLLAAKEALKKGDFERASSLATQSKEISKGLKDEGEAISGVKEAWRVLEDVTAGQEQAKQDELKKTQESTRRLKDEIVGVESAVKAIAEAFRSVNLQLAAEPVKPKLDASELQKGLEIHQSLDGKHTESEHVIHFKGEGSEEKPISEKIKDLKTLLEQYRQMAASGATSVTQFVGQNSGGEKGLTETIKNLEQQIADLQAQIETPTELKVDTTKAEAALDSVADADAAKKKEAKAAEAKRGTGMIADRDIDDSAHRPEKDAAAYEVDEALAQKIDNKKTEMSLYKQAAEASASSGDGLYTVYINRVNELFTQIQALEREMKAKKKLKGFNTGGSVPGSGSGDIVPAMLTPNEFVQPVSAVRTYGVDFMEAIRKRRLSVAAVRAQMAGVRFNTGGLVRPSIRIPDLPDIRPRVYMNAGGVVPTGSPQVTERIQVDLNIGGNTYSGLFKKSEARGMIEELKRAKARAI